jgi:hypothetical protein
MAVSVVLRYVIDITVERSHITGIVRAQVTSDEWRCTKGIVLGRAGRQQCYGQTVTPLAMVTVPGSRDITR